MAVTPETQVLTFSMDAAHETQILVIIVVIACVTQVCKASTTLTEISTQNHSLSEAVLKQFVKN